MTPSERGRASIAAMIERGTWTGLKRVRHVLDAKMPPSVKARYRLDKRVGRDRRSRYEIVPSASQSPLDELIEREEAE